MDRYKGVLIEDMKLLPDTEEEFNKTLEASLTEWSKKGARSIQIKF